MSLSLASYEAGGLHGEAKNEEDAVAAAAAFPLSLLLR